MKFVITKSNCSWQTIFEIFPCFSAKVTAYSSSFIVVSRFKEQFRHSTNQQFLSTFCVSEVRCFVPGVIRSNFFFWLISDGSFFPKRRLASPVMYWTLKRLLRLMNTKVYKMQEIEQTRLLIGRWILRRHWGQRILKWPNGSRAPEDRGTAFSQMYHR